MQIPLRELEVDVWINSQCKTDVAPLTEIDLPNPLPDRKMMEVIYYDFVPQLLSIL